ncbi:glycine betaine ABC transporter substrate-binding protein [Cohnella silvisoli]|uniref:glycine betaine ABC transporter substrate-binding protein n=1 Tax=Cohnella silvisoli TaxID=2873699 RepID=UPI0028167B90|nr:glycine betaine ABC transporter substrate-binding protein [Cohnella silvisoli]MCD9021432.1 hypothetical protein [Cohnella silvisoli]
MDISSRHDKALQSLQLVGLEGLETRFPDQLSGGTPPDKAASEWITDNPDLVNEWIKNTPAVSGQKLKLAYVAWDSEIASTHVVKAVLETRLGYKFDMLQVEIGPMWAGIANGDADAMVAASSRSIWTFNR